MNSVSSKLAAVAALLVLSFAGQGQALVTVNHATTAVSPLTIGQEFTVTVRLTWDGNSSTLQGVFASTTFDSDVIEYVSNTNFPASILAFVDPETEDVIPGLSRLGGLQQPGDPGNILPTAQYSGTSPVDTRAATTETGRLLTTITFRAIAEGETDIETVIANGDVGATGDDFALGTVAAIQVPEPGQALLGLMSLASVAGVVAVRRRL